MKNPKTYQVKNIQTLEESVQQMKWEIAKIQDELNLKLFQLQNRQKLIKEKMDKTVEELRFLKAVEAEQLKYA